MAYFTESSPIRTSFEQKADGLKARRVPRTPSYKLHLALPASFSVEPAAAVAPADAPAAVASPSCRAKDVLGAVTGLDQPGPPPPHAAETPMRRWISLMRLRTSAMPTVGEALDAAAMLTRLGSAGPQGS